MIPFWLWLLYCVLSGALVGAPAGFLCAHLNVPRPWAILVIGLASILSGVTNGFLCWWLRTHGYLQ